MKSLLFLIPVLFATQLPAQCVRTYKVTYFNKKTQTTESFISDVELRTGFFLYLKTKNEIFKDNDGRNIFAITLKSGNRVVGKIKVGKGNEIIYCSQNACDVNCEMFKSSFYATDIYGTKSYFEPLSY